ncbi:hypothetical protein [Bradyrhizobium sp. 17]|nr:hypothetical protein [Bradyrhizobium sp. 17]MCK1520243.1 hypothetical protein [Bradyrhizobium sp. 17]
MFSSSMIGPPNDRLAGVDRAVVQLFVDPLEPEVEAERDEGERTSEQSQD